MTKLCRNLSILPELLLSHEHKRFYCEVFKRTMMNLCFVVFCALGLISLKTVQIRSYELRPEDFTIEDSEYCKCGVVISSPSVLKQKLPMTVLEIGWCEAWLHVLRGSYTGGEEPKCSTLTCGSKCQLFTPKGEKLIPQCLDNACLCFNEEGDLVHM
ncbi:hypothetical protein J6590_002731 [Homalodisca vitripennis]|nr:hypothetical protein J6590_002731 [Homalodisca vitripennis]